MSLTQQSLNVVSTCSNMQATYSRSSSTASLSSFDIKSIHSSAASEYSCANRQETLSTGLITPSGYSDLPDSPGEIFPYTAMNRNKNILNTAALLEISAEKYSFSDY